MSTDLPGSFPCYPNDITPKWLTARLAESGVLPSGVVTAITVDQIRMTVTARTARLTVDYDAKAVPDAPRRMFMKLCEPNEQMSHLVARELAFYKRDLPANMPVARCHYAHFDEETGVTLFLLDDLGDTHGQTPWPLPPTLPMCEAAVTALANLHALGWQKQQPETGLANASLREEHEEFAGYIKRTLPKFFDFLDDRLPQDRQALMRTVGDRLPVLLWERVSIDRAITLVHGDAHFWNVMLPNDLSRDHCVFIDWQTWRRGVGAFDLAYMIGLHWYPDRRARHEEQMLRAYHRALPQDISADYGWDELYVDYRLGHLFNLVVPLHQWDLGLFPAIWWPHLERWFLAYADLGCADLL